MVCPVLGWQNAVALTRQHLTKANAGPKKGNQDGRQQTVFQRFCHQLGQKSKILLNLLTRQNLDAIEQLYFVVLDTPKITIVRLLWFFIGQSILLLLIFIYVNWC